MDNNSRIGCASHSHKRANIDTHYEVLTAIQSDRGFSKRANAFIFQNVGNFTAYIHNNGNYWTLFPGAVKAYGNSSNTDFEVLDFQVKFSTTQTINVGKEDPVKRVEVEAAIAKTCSCNRCQNR